MTDPLDPNTQPMTPADLAAAQALCDAAGPPWHSFISGARGYIPRLVHHVRILQRQDGAQAERLALVGHERDGYRDLLAETAELIATVASEAFGPFPVQEIEANITAIERGIAGLRGEYNAERAERGRLRAKLDSALRCLELVAFAVDEVAAARDTAQDEANVLAEGAEPLLAAAETYERQLREAGERERALTLQIAGLEERVAEAERSADSAHATACEIEAERDQLLADETGIEADTAERIAAWIDSPGEDEAWASFEVHGPYTEWLTARIRAGKWRP